MIIFFPHIMPNRQNFRLEKGAIFDLPVFCQKKISHKKCINYYNKIKSTQGMSICPYGFNSFSTILAGSNVILTSMKIEEYVIKGKLKNKIIDEFIPILTEKKFIDLLAINKQILNTELALKQSEKKIIGFNDQLFSNIHEIRKLNGEIKGQAEHASLLCEKNESNNTFLKFRIDNIYHTSSLVSIRLDFYDWQMNPKIINSMPKIPIEIYKKFDKVKHCLNSHCNTCGIKMVFEGESYTTILGVQIFDLLPFLILENATKYSTQNQTVTVKFSNYSDYETLEV